MNTVEDYLIDAINKKYAARIFRKVNTEWERLGMDGKEPGKTEYEWMVERVLEIHRQLNTTVPEEQEEVKDDEEAED